MWDKYLKYLCETIYIPNNVQQQIFLRTCTKSPLREVSNKMCQALLGSSLSVASARMTQLMNLLNLRRSWLKGEKM